MHRLATCRRIGFDNTFQKKIPKVAAQPKKKVAVVPEGSRESLKIPLREQL
jgi:hypothetical protein